MTTVLPTPAPPKMPILPPLANGQTRSMTLMPVSKEGRRLHRALLVDRMAEDVEDATEGHLADGDGDRAPGVASLHTAREAVRRRHRDGADPVVPEVLLNLADERGLALAAVDLDGVVDGGQSPGREPDVHDRAGDADHPAGRECGGRHQCRRASVQRLSARSRQTRSRSSRV
jgi:hypothetical protein